MYLCDRKLKIDEKQMIMKASEFFIKVVLAMAGSSNFNPDDKFDRRAIIGGAQKLTGEVENVLMNDYGEGFLSESMDTPVEAMSDALCRISENAIDNFGRLNVKIDQ